MRDGEPVNEKGRIVACYWLLVDCHLLPATSNQQPATSNKQQLQIGGEIGDVVGHGIMPHQKFAELFSFGQQKRDRFIDLSR
jgi:hypothetical protein